MSRGHNQETYSDISLGEGQDQSQVSGHTNKKSEEKSLTTALMTPSEIKGRAFIFDLENNDPNSKNLNGLSDLSRSLAS